MNASPHEAHEARAVIFDAPGRPLRRARMTPRAPARGEVSIKVHACAVCRTDLHIVDGELAHPKLPLILGHQIAGTIERCGADAGELRPGMRVGVPWLGWTCGDCRYCKSGRENLCDNARFTGYDRDGGYAEQAIADHRFVIPLPSAYTFEAAAPLLCGGLIGFRSLRLAGDAERVGMYGFGAAAHIIAQVATHRGQKVYAFTREGDAEGQKLALDMGCVWAGHSGEKPPEPLDAAIVFAPVGSLVPVALERVAKGGVVVCGGIHMSDIPTFPYEILWGERSIRSVANLTRKDGEDFFAIAREFPIRAAVRTFPLEEAEAALEALRTGKIHGSAVIVP